MRVYLDISLECLFLSSPPRTLNPLRVLAFVALIGHVANGLGWRRG